jgi:Fe-S cluster assembly protein SufD
MKINMKDNLVTEFEILESLLAKEGKKNKDLEQRKKAIDHFKNNGFPTLKDEQWKYTPVNFMNKIDFKLLNNSTASKISEEEIQKTLIAGNDVFKIVLVNGYFDEVHSDAGSDEDGFSVHSTKEYFGENPDSNLVESLPDYSEHPFAAVNTALSHDGFILSIARNVQLKKPVHIINIIDTDNEPVYAQPRNFIIAGENSEAKVVESFTTLGYNESLTSAVTKIETKQNSKLKYYRIQDDNDISHGVNLIEADSHRDSQFTQMNVTLGGKFVRNDVRVRLIGENAYPSLEGVFIAKRDMLVDNHTFLDHAVPNCPSNEIYRAVLDDKARGVFNGKIMVRQDAQKTNAYQSSKAVLLSDSAIMNSKPELEIYADDVKCSHGASTGSIDPDSLFYLRARGIPEKQAKAMLLNSFVHEITNRIEIEELRDNINSRIDELFRV